MARTICRFGTLSAIFLTVLAAAPFVGCGARSSLFVSFRSSDGDGGSGASGGFGGAGGGNPMSSSSSSTSDGGGGFGGFDPNCPVFVNDVVEPVSLAGGSLFHQRGPKLTFTNAASSRMTVASGWQSVEGPSPLPTELRHSSFFPFESWPAGDFGPTYLADFDGGVTFAIDSQGGALFAALLGDGDTSTPLAGIHIQNGLVANSGDFVSPVQLDAEASDALFVVNHDAGEVLAGTRASDEPDLGIYSMRLTTMTPVNGNIVGPNTIACADLPPTAGAVAANGFDSSVFMVATSNSGNPGDSVCEFGAGNIGGPNRLQVLIVDNQGDFFPVQDLEMPGEILRLKVAPIVVEGFLEGMWIAFTIIGPESPYVGLMRVDASGLVQQSLAVSDELVEPSVLELGTMGNEHHALVGYGQSDGVLPSVGFKLFDQDGNELAQLGFSSAAVLSDILGSPNELMAVAAFTELEPNGRNRVLLQRLECLFPPE